jgi:AcrR family transcriptional regulator
MPRVSDDHLERRRRQILDAARRCFIRKGFHQTSMQDVFAESGLSAGAVYRYFKSKNELVTSIAEAVVGDLDGILEQLTEQDPPLTLLDVMQRTLDFADRQSEPDGMLPIAIQVWAESLRDPALAAFVRAKYGRFRTRFVTIAERAQRAGELPAGADPEAVGAVLFGLVPGYFLQRVLTGAPERESYLAGVRTLLAPAATAQR